MSDTYNFQELDNLSEKEREIAISILKEFSDKGQSDKFN
jgi:hypothetical protein